MNVSPLPLNVAAADVSAAPHFATASLPAMSGANWDSAISQYWSGKGVQIPQTGGNTGSSSSTTGATASTFMIKNPIVGYTVNGSDNKSVGTVVDFLVNVQTGQIMYAVMSAAGLPAGQLFAVPVNGFTWQVAGGAVTGLPTNLTASNFSGAPSVTALSGFAHGSWQSDVSSFWSKVIK